MIKDKLENFISYKKRLEESEKEYKAFCKWRDLPEYARDFGFVARDLKMSVEELTRLYRKRDWETRTEDFDCDRRINRQMLEKECQEEIKEYQLIMTSVLTEIGLTEIQRYFNKQKGEEDVLITMPLSTALEIYKTTIDKSRLLNAEATEIIENRSNSLEDLSALSHDDLLAMKRINEKLAKR